MNYFLPKSPISFFLYQIVDGGLVLEGWNMRSDHMPEEKSLQSIIFGKTGVKLELADEKPVLTVPRNLKVGMIQSDHAFNKEEQFVRGTFVKILFY